MFPVMAVGAQLQLLQLLAFAALLDGTAGQGQGQPEPVPPPFNATVIRAFREKVLLNPPPVPDRNPYDLPQPPPPPPGWETVVCGVLYEDEQTRTRYRLENYTDVDAARAAGAHVTHETPCGLCSSLEDLAVYMSVWDMTAPVRACVALGAIDRPAGLDCLHELGLTPPCATIWMDNGDYTRENCLLPCLVHLGSPYNEPEGCWRNPSNGCELNPCLQCDEDVSGPIFQQFAARTRRNSGLRSAIWRPPDTIADIVHDYW